MGVRPNIKNNWVLHHDNAPCHMAISINVCLASKNIPLAPQPPYSPDLSPLSEFQHCYEDWKNRLHHCVASKRSYFEGDNIEL
ncbi:hypothetical protein ANTRET_LOCUS4785 [Anthophora retusa]